MLAVAQERDALWRGTAASPPRGFRGAEGVRSAWPEATSPFGRTPTLRGKSPAQKNGIRYERKVHEHLDALFPSLYRPSQWFRFTDQHGKMRWCQPDGLLCLGSLAVIFEVKSRFCADAWWQLRRLYEPVVRRAYYADTIGLVTVCRHYDAAVPFPEPPVLIDDLERFVVRRCFDRVGVLSWRP